MLVAQWKEFQRERGGAVAVLAALTLVPLMIMAGAAVDYGRALNASAQMQAAIDSAVLYGASLPAAQQVSAADASVRAGLAGTDLASTVSTSFSATGTEFSGSVSAVLPMSILSAIGIQQIEITRRAGAADKVYESACVQSYGKGMATSANSITLNGTPSLDLSGCEIQSNTSVKCNGSNNGNAAATYATGQATSCNNSRNGAAPIPDVYASLASNITRQCNWRFNSTWSPGSPPDPSHMVTIYKTDYTEYHVCGDVTFSGSGSLTGSSPVKDSVIIVEDGSVTLSNGANIALTHATVVLTGSNAANITHQINFPNGNGNGAELTITPSGDSNNPWQGVSIFQDPSLTTNININWSSGATLLADGLVYFGAADLTMSGTAGGAGGACTKLAANSMTLSGNITLAESDANCAAVGMNRYEYPPYLVN